MQRRNLLMGGSAFVALAAATRLIPGAASTSDAHASEGVFEISLTESEWRERLTDDQFNILRKEATERPYTSPLNDEKREGLFACAGCDLPLFDSSTKYDSGTGWPSFYQPIDGAIGTKEDRKLFAVRTEVHCSRCGGHQGHVFDDGPPPTGKRYCINGLALKFVPASA